MLARLFYKIDCETFDYSNGRTLLFPHTYLYSVSLYLRFFRLNFNGFVITYDIPSKNAGELFNTMSWISWPSSPIFAFGDLGFLDWALANNYNKNHRKNQLFRDVKKLKLIRAPYHFSLSQVKFCLRKTKCTKLIH